MGDLRELPELSEDKTEPFSQTEIQARLERSRREELPTTASAIPLDSFVVPPDEHIRILLRPLAPGRALREHPSVRQIDLLAADGTDGEDAAPHKVLAVRQTAQDVNFPVQISKVRCHLYYDPARDHIVLSNSCDIPFLLSRVSQDPDANTGASLPIQIDPRARKVLAPGTWRITLGDTDLLDFRPLERPSVLLRRRSPSASSSEASEISELVKSTGKRSFVAGDDDYASPEKRRRPSGPAPDRDEDQVVFFMPSKAADEGKQVAAFTGHPLLDLKPDETLEVPPGQAIVGYTITKKKPIASTSSASVFMAEYSGSPGTYIVAKVLNTTLSSKTESSEAMIAKRVIQQAETWLSELRNHAKLKHDNIVQLHGGDARFLSIYMESIDGRDLSTEHIWRAVRTDLFMGNRSDAIRILKDLSRALKHLHGLALQHNDIKPGNVLYSRERGAVLCDLGLSTMQGARVGGGTPWYVGPELIRGLGSSKDETGRGPPSDIWALGVLMLYILGKISWPDIRGHRNHPRYLFWMIAEANDWSKPAPMRMQTWLTEVRNVRAGLDVHDQLERLVHGMLTPHPKERPTAAEILRELEGEEGGR
ncbi:kinase-like domain-containing protein [Staphylotrichum tortipilum]|uniref:Kinase-like domain-containing protein n=1 Tax=Staphylotrichum tortipilum TaxID=2831512 RepID=A0AAN6MA28_9PEZI|nr:kinase-like domain-containing protein [Staphylotrichum longicolle]